MMNAEHIARVRIQASLTEKALLALVAIHSVGVFLEPASRIAWGVGLTLALLAFVGAFLSQHNFTLACQHEMDGNVNAENQRIITGNRWYVGGLVMAFASIAAIVIAL